LPQAYDYYFSVREHDRTVILEIEGSKYIFRLSIENAESLATALTKAVLEAQTKYKNVIPIRGTNG